jgi:putative ABC transport system ATP-binding protein
MNERDQGRHVTDAVVELSRVTKRYGEASREVYALRGVDLLVYPGQLVSVMGPSGSGKSTLLNLIAGLDWPTEGRVLVEGMDVSSLGDFDLARLRRRSVAFIFQFFNLLPTLTAAQNVAVPLRADGRPRPEIEARVAAALETVGVAHRGSHYPNELSGGEMQRVAIARALATDARVILADEPTGNLDTARGEEIMALLRQATEVGRKSIILVTHDVRAAAHGDRMITLRDGLIVDEIVNARGANVVPLRGSHGAE